MMKTNKIDLKVDTLYTPSKEILEHEYKEYFGYALDVKEWIKSKNAYAVASNQLGFNKAFFVAGVDWKKLGLPTDIYFNATYLPDTYNEECKELESVESCLSFPKEEFTVRRFSHISAVYYDPRDKCKKSCLLNGISAIVYQHEVDHLFGVPCADKQIVVEEENNENNGKDLT